MIDYQFIKGFNHYGKKTAFVGKEDVLQQHVGTFLDLNRNTRKKWFHPPNGGKRPDSVKWGKGGQAVKYSAEGKKLKRMGVKSGVPDCMICQGHGEYVGLAIELKVKYKSGRFNRLQDSQKDWLRILSSCGWFTCVCYSVSSVEFVVKNFYSKKQDL